MRKTISFMYPEGKIQALTMSYDDGVIEDRQLVDIFNKYKIKGSFHINAGLLGNGNRLASQEISGLYKGHEISCHGFTHPYFDRISRPELVREILDDRTELEKLSGYPVRGLSYPYGVWNTETLEVLKSLGIVYSRTTVSTGKFILPDNFLEWHPTCHHSDKLMERAGQFRKTARNFSLLYVWGHAYEFARQNNWELMESFCKFIAGDEKIWYATNIEIYDYIMIMKHLEFSADCTMVKNPSAAPAWLLVDGAPVKIMPGELKQL
ncbi:MAG: polysaccharide deacetylase [Lentisphaerae bacterium GWF2_44_16]|nr:MAG: polysaccharide deacetylase [Lentisphaerae bacterium GWF2_44_16]